MELYEKAEKTEKSALVFIARMYATGKGVQQDMQKALEYCQKAENSQDAAVFITLADALSDDSSGLPNDIKRAEALLRRALGEGLSVAAEKLIELSRSGKITLPPAEIKTIERRGKELELFGRGFDVDVHVR